MVVECAPRFRASGAYKHDARAYVLTEEARLRCEALSTVARTDERRRELRRLHRDLGLCGLYLSTNIPSSIRRTLLARVHARCERLECRRHGTVRGLTRTVRRAARALGRAAAKAGPAEHRELAGLHLHRAMEFLVPTPTSRPSVAHVFRQRHPA